MSYKLPLLESWGLPVSILPEESPGLTEDGQQRPGPAGGCVGLSADGASSAACSGTRNTGSTLNISKCADLYTLTSPSFLVTLPPEPVFFFWLMLDISIPFCNPFGMVLITLFYGLILGTDPFSALIGTSRATGAETPVFWLPKEIRVRWVLPYSQIPLVLPFFAIPGAWLSRWKQWTIKFSFCSAYAETEPASVSDFSVFFVLLALPCCSLTLFLASSKTQLLDTYDIRIWPSSDALTSSVPFTSPHHKSYHQSWWLNRHIDSLYIY